MVSFIGPDGLLETPSRVALPKILLDYMHPLLLAYAPSTRNIDCPPFVNA
jgi:hypothetical protein